MSERKYELTEETITYAGRTLHRIRALRDFGDVQRGDLGGWVESDGNLSHERLCWVSGDGQVFGNGRVSGNGWVSDNGRVSGSGRIRFTLTTDDPVDIIAATLDVRPVNGWYYLFKRVNATDDPKVFSSCHDPEFKYVVGKRAVVKDADPNPMLSCGPGIHISTASYWTEGDTLIAVKVKVKDVLACQSGKLRCRAVTVLGRCE